MSKRMKNYNAIDTFLDECLQLKAFSCVSAGIGVYGETLHTCVKGRLSQMGNEMADINTRFDMASLTKILSPTMLALLALEDGKITLNDNLSMYFEAPEDKKDITVFQLMTHTAGFHPSFRLDECCETAQDAQSAILKHPLEHCPGSVVDYSCMGYILLGMILEKIDGKSLCQLAEEKIFVPLGMGSTGYLPRGINFAATECIMPEGLPLSGVVHDENARFLNGVSANAGVFSSLHDCLRFAAMLSHEGTPLISKGTFRLAVQNHTPFHKLHRGLGFNLPSAIGSFAGDLFPQGSFGHTGFTGTSLLVDPETGFYAVLLTNAIHPLRGQTDMLRLRACFHNIAYAIFSK